MGTVKFYRKQRQSCRQCETLIWGFWSPVPAPCLKGESSPEASTPPWLPLRRCVSSSSLDYGSMDVARWWSLPIVRQYKDLVSCLTLSRFICVIVLSCCVCWYPLNCDVMIRLCMFNIWCYLLSCLCFIYVLACSPIHLFTLAKFMCESPRGSIC
jgi:hypothetical protein